MGTLEGSKRSAAQPRLTKISCPLFFLFAARKNDELDLIHEQTSSWGNKDTKIYHLLNQLLGDHTSRSEHRKTSILQLLRLHDGKFLGILGFQAEGIESDIARIMVVVQVLEAEGSFRRDESIQSAVDFEGTDEEGEGDQGR